MSFFVKSRKRKSTFFSKSKSPVGATDSKSKLSKKKLAIQKALSEEIESSDSDAEGNIIDAKDNKDVLYSSEEEDEETAQQKKLRLAKDYIAQLEAEEADKRQDEETLKAAVADRLQEDVSEQQGKVIRNIADECLCPAEQDLRIFRGHKLPVTCIVISPDDKYVFTASKDCNICKWNVETGTKVKTLKGGRKGTENVHIGHTNQILCLAISSDGKYLAAGDKEKMIKLWNPEDLSFIHRFMGHRGAVTGVAFRKKSHTLFSCSDDKTVKVWNVDELAYQESLFGHNTPITAIDSLARERAITSGGRDSSVHVWKIVEDSQLIFNGHGCSIECVALISESHFVTGGDDNTVSLWSVLKKKPAHIIRDAHNLNHSNDMWVSAVASLQHTDIVASGSRDGFVRLWKCTPGFQSMCPMFAVPVKGFVNSLAFSSKGDFLVAGVGQEHRLGRWWRNKEAKNGWVLIPINRKSPTLNGFT